MHALEVGTKVVVFDSPDGEEPAGRGTVQQVYDDDDGVAKVEVRLDWDQADGRPAIMRPDHSCVRVDSEVTKVGAKVVMKGTNKAKRFVEGHVTAVKNPDMVQVSLGWNLADGKPATLFTPAKNLILKSVADDFDEKVKSKKELLARTRHAALFKSRTKVCILTSDGSNRAFAFGTVIKNRFSSKSCVVDLPWRLADGKPARL